VIDIDEIEMMEKNERIIIRDVSGEDDKERSERKIINKWVKLMWE
jgi:hypothetical protein